MFLNYLEQAILASIDAGQEINKIYRSCEDIQMTKKSDDSPLTIADKAAHDSIVKYLTSTNLPILSEEGAKVDWEIRKHWSLFWMVDPLDGTKEFINRNGEFTVNIALIKEGKPVLGVVYLPTTQTLYYGTSELGAFKQKVKSKHKGGFKLEEAITLPSTKTDIFTIAVSKSHLSDETKRMVDACKAQYGDVETISCGSSKKLCLLAEEKVNLYPRLAPTMEWDTAAAHAIVNASGKHIIDFETKAELVYNKQSLLNPFFIAHDNKFNPDD